METKECRQPPGQVRRSAEELSRGQRAAVAACPAKYAGVEHEDEGVPAAAGVVVWRSAGEMPKGTESSSRCVPARVEHGDEGVQAAADVVVWRSAGEMSKRK